MKKISSLYQQIFDNISEGCACFQAVFNEENSPIDFTFLFVNRIFEQDMELEKDEVIGKNLSTVFPSKQHYKMIESLKKSVSHKTREYFELYQEHQKKWYSVQVICPQQGILITLFNDIFQCEAVDENPNLQTKHLLEEEKLLKTVINTLINPIFYKNIAGIYTGCNEAFAEYTGVPKEEIIGASVYDLFPEELADVYYKADCNLLRKKKDQVYETKLKHADGTLRDVVFYKSILLDEKGEARGIVGNVIDITKRKSTERELQQIKKELENALIWKNAIFDTSSIGMLALTGDRIITEVNPMMEELFGFSKDEMMGKNVAMIHVSKETYRHFGVRFYMQTAFHKTVETEYQFKRKDGKLFWAKISGSAIDSKDLSKGVIWAIIDITKRKEKEKEVEEIKGLMEAAFEQNPTPMILMSYPDKVLRIINTASLKFLEIEDMYEHIQENTLDDLVLLNEQISKVYYSDGTLVENEKLPLFLALRGISTKNQELKIITETGKEKWSLVSGGPIFNKQGNLIAGMIAFPEITKLKLIEKELEKKNSLLIEANQILREKSVKDSLTNIYNHQFIFNALQKTLEQAERYEEKVSIMMADIDHFKRVNDVYGHQTGDQVIIGVAKIIRENIRKADLLGRYGGEEYLVILPRTSQKEALVVAEKIRQNIENESFTSQGLKVTISIGVAEYCGEKVTALVNKADECLYKAKRRGRNRIGT